MATALVIMLYVIAMQLGEISDSLYVFIIVAALSAVSWDVRQALKKKS